MFLLYILGISEGCVVSWLEQFSEGYYSDLEKPASVHNCLGYLDANCFEGTATAVEMYSLL
jgi:hypothetical protein